VLPVQPLGPGYLNGLIFIPNSHDDTMRLG
jgi:hypothetical protein